MSDVRHLNGNDIPCRQISVNGFYSALLFSLLSPHRSKFLQTWKLLGNDDCITKDSCTIHPKFCNFYVRNWFAKSTTLEISMFFHYGRAFEINDLAVAPDFQGRGIATALLERHLADVKECGVKGVNLITAGSGALPGFYEKHGFRRERRVILMGKEL